MYRRCDLDYLDYSLALVEPAICSIPWTRMWLNKIDILFARGVLTPVTLLVNSHFLPSIVSTTETMDV
jgi:hypothetical protein